MFKNGSDCAGQTPYSPLYASKLDWLIGTIVISISLQWQAICQFSRHRYLWNIHARLTDFDN